MDEAQSLPLELLEEIRLLSNIETNEEKLLSLIIAGQPELANRLHGSVAAPVEAAYRAAMRAATVELAGVDRIHGRPDRGCRRHARADLLARSGCAHP